MHSSACYLSPAPIQMLNYENQKFKAFKPLVYCYEEHLVLNGYFPPWLDLLWFGKASCFCATGNKKDPKSLTSHHVKNSISWSHFKNHSQLYSGKVQPTRNCWVESQPRAQALGKLLTGILRVRRVWMRVHRSLCLKREEQIMCQICQRAGRTQRHQLLCLSPSPDFQSRWNRVWPPALPFVGHFVTVELFWSFGFLYYIKERTPWMIWGFRETRDRPQAEGFLCVTRSSAWPWVSPQYCYSGQTVWIRTGTQHWLRAHLMPHTALSAFFF